MANMKHIAFVKFQNHPTPMMALFVGQIPEGAHPSTITGHLIGKMRDTRGEALAEAITYLQQELATENGR